MSRVCVARKRGFFLRCGTGSQPVCLSQWHRFVTGVFAGSA